MRFSDIVVIIGGGDGGAFSHDMNNHRDMDNFSRDFASRVYLYFFCTLN